MRGATSAFITSRPMRCTARWVRAIQRSPSDTPYAPNSPYAASKAASDHLVRAYDHTYGLPVTISNCSNNYGPYHFPEKLIPLMVIARAGGRAAARLRRRARTCATGSTWRTTVVPSMQYSRAGPSGRSTTSAGATNGAISISCVTCAPSRSALRGAARAARPVPRLPRCPRTHHCGVDRFRDGSARARLALRDRLHKDRERAGVRPARAVRDGYREDGRLVPRQRSMVARCSRRRRGAWVLTIASPARAGCAPGAADGAHRFSGDNLRRGDSAVV